MSARESYTAVDGDLARAVAFALNRRVGAGRGIAVKQFAYEMGVSEQSVWSWQAGHKAPSANKLVRMIGFFDPCFFNEVMQHMRVNRKAYVASDETECRRAERITGTAQALRALAAIAPLLAEEPVE